METLETRYALSSLTTIDPDSCLPVEDEQEAVESTVSVSDPAPAEGEEEVFVGPLEADVYYESLAESELPAQEGEDTGSTTSGDPTIWTFSVSYDGNYWIIAGELTDDQDPSNCRVTLYFDGTPQQLLVEVMPDGSFFRYEIERPGSIVSAVATDADGNTSNMMTTIV